MPAGCVDGDPGARADRHIFTGPEHNPTWFPITDGLDQAETFHANSPPLPLVEPQTPPEAAADALNWGNLSQTASQRECRQLANTLRRHGWSPYWR